MVTTMSGPLRDLLHAWRGLRQKPGFLVGSLLTLAIGIGANVTIFSFVNGLSLRPMPFGDRTDRLVTMHPTNRFEHSDPDWGDAEISYADFLDFRTSSSVDGMAAYFLRNFVLSGDTSSAERVIGGSVTPGTDHSAGRIHGGETADEALETGNARVAGVVLYV